MYLQSVTLAALISLMLQYFGIEFKFKDDTPILSQLSDYVFGSQILRFGPEKVPFTVGGYFENYNKPNNPGEGKNTDPSYYYNDFVPIDNVYYGFLSLAKTPDPKSPPAAKWDGICIYETETRDCIQGTLNFTGGWHNPDNWQALKVKGMLGAAKLTGSKFIWSIGGYSDLQFGMDLTLTDTFASDVAFILKRAGDGIDFMFEHMSNVGDDSQLKVFAAILKKTRKALDDAGMQNKKIGYTCLFNSFWNDDNRPDGYTPLMNDGEGLTIDKALKDQQSSLGGLVDYVNVMFYDVDPGMFPTGKISLQNYKDVLNEVQKVIPKGKIMMGFEPGAQAGGGVWEGMDMDKAVIDYLKKNSYGGAMFWSLNQPGGTGDNAHTLALYARNSQN